MKRNKKLKTVGVVRESARNSLKKEKEKTWNKTRRRTYIKIGFLSCFSMQKNFVMWFLKKFHIKNTIINHKNI